jgi:hypothetical protein
MLSPDLLTQPLMVVWSAEEVPVEVALEPLWLLVVPAAAPLWSADGVELAGGLAVWSLPLGVEPELLPACANVMPAVINRMLVK